MSSDNKMLSSLEREVVHYVCGTLCADKQIYKKNTNK